jgi:hypothetical protein
VAAPRHADREDAAAVDDRQRRDRAQLRDRDAAAAAAAQAFAPLRPPIGQAQRHDLARGEAGHRHVALDGGRGQAERQRLHRRGAIGPDAPPVVAGEADHVVLDGGTRMRSPATAMPPRAGVGKGARQRISPVAGSSAITSARPVAT